MNGYYNGYPGYIPDPIRSYGTYAPLTRNIMPAATRAPSILGAFTRSTPGILGSTALGSTATAGTKAFTFGGLLNGASKTLGVINQAIPVVYQIKPIWNNAKTMFRVAKAINSPDKTNSTSNIVTTANTENTNKSSSNGPTFYN